MTRRKPPAAKPGTADREARILLAYRMSKDGTMLQDEHERRAMRRFDMRLPATVQFTSGGDEFITETQNISARGVFLYLDRIIAPNTRIKVTLTFPPHVTLTDSLRVRFTARVLRVEDPLPSARIGVAALIEDYEFLSSVPTSLAGAASREWKPSL